MLIHWIWLATRPAVSDRQKAALLHAFRDPEDVYFGEKSAYSNVEGLTTDAADALADKNLTRAQEILDQCVEKDIQICTFHDAAYPGRLKNIGDPPIVLYYRGHLGTLDSCPVIGVVGTQKASVYGLTTASRMGYQIAKCGGIVVSGLALGIDGNAMKGAMTAGGTVVGVLGCGIDVVYPPTHKSLYLDTERCGCLLSEFPPETPPISWNFPKRNRIISGISNGVLVVEAPQKSGALITARQALEQGRDVFVVPGNIDVPTFQGSNHLLREGAIAVSSGWDVVGEYEALYPGKVGPVQEEAYSRIQPERVEMPMAQVAQRAEKPAQKSQLHQRKKKKVIDNGENAPYSDQKDQLVSLNEEEKKLLAPLKNGECQVDQLIAESGLSTSKVLSMLTLLQIRGIIKLLPGKRVALK